MTFAPTIHAARIAIAAALVGTVALATPSPSRAGGNSPRIMVGYDETILFPVPECPNCLALAPGRSLDDRLVGADCACPD